MSNTFSVQILEPTTNIISIETSVGNVVNNIEIERYQTFNVEIVNTEKILVSDLPNNIPMDYIVGNLDVGRIDNLDEYLETIDIDGGSP
jgi:L-cysteine desulfidase